MIVAIYLVAVQKMNIHWFRITKPFGYPVTSIFVGARRFATLFKQKAISSEELYDIVSLLNKLCLILVPIQTSTNRINTPNLLIS